jgi:aldehyde dehydrogenase (NAD+)
MTNKKLFATLGLDAKDLRGGEITVCSPIDGALIASLRADTARDLKRKIDRAQQAFLTWRTLPAPRRGELIRLLGDELRRNK